MSTRDGRRDELMIFLQGGGACGSTNCDAVDQAPLGIPPIAVRHDREVADTSPRQWVVDMLKGDDAWGSVTD
jgi:hypothetical protein